MYYVWKIFSRTLLIVPALVLAQEPNHPGGKKPTLEEKIKRDQQYINKMMEEGMFQGMDSIFRTMLRGFDPELEKDLNQFFDQKKIDSLLKKHFNFNQFSTGETKWLETPTHRILAIKVSQGKEQPLDIKIEGGSISIKGEVINERKKVGPDGKEQVVSRSSSYFSRTMAIPNDVYGEKAQFENKDGSVFIKFPKRLASKKPIKKQKKPKNGPDVRPLKKDSSDITI